MLRLVLKSWPILIGLIFSINLFASIESSKRFTIFLDLNPLQFNIDRLVEADEFVLRMSLAKGLFKETNQGEILPDMAKEFHMNPVSGEVYLTLRDDLAWSNGEKIKIDDVVLSLNNINNRFKKKFNSCLVKPIITLKSKVKFVWDLKSKKCGNPLEILAHPGMYIFYPNNNETIAEFVKKYPLSSSYKLLKLTEDKISLKHIGRPYVLEYRFNSDHNVLSENIIYKRLNGLDTEGDKQRLSIAGVSQTLSFEANGLSEVESASLGCLARDLSKALIQKYPKLIPAHSYSFQTSQALNIEARSYEEKCRPFLRPIELSRQFLDDYPEIGAFLQKRQIKTILLSHKKWKARWFNEKIAVTIRLQKVRTNNIHSLFFSYFQSGISPYRRIQALIKNNIQGIEDKNLYIKKSLEMISDMGLLTPIVHVPTFILTSKKCARNAKSDIYLDFEEYLEKCGEI